MTTKFSDIDIGSIDHLCQMLAQKGDYQTLANLVKTNREIHTICQRYLTKARQLRQKQEKQQLQMSEKEPDVRLYPDIPDYHGIDMEEMEEHLVDELRDLYGHDIHITPNTDKKNRYYFEVTGKGASELLEDYFMHGQDNFAGQVYTIELYINDKRVD